MLSELAIKNFAIIDDVRISFDRGLSVLTGETGAGKSMIISAVNLLLGSRSSADLVRSGCEMAELEACFEIAPDSHAAKVLSDQGMAPDDGLIVRRIISSTGKSRVFINSRQSTLELLKTVTRNLAGISSQHAHQGLLHQENHLQILDEFAGTSDLCKKVHDLYHTLIPLKKEMSGLCETLEQQKKDQELLQYQVDEIQAAAIEPDEELRLEKQRDVLMNAAKIFEAVNRAVHEIYDRDSSLVGRLSDIQRLLTDVGASDDRINSIGERLSGIMFDLQDISGELRDVSDTIDLDPASLETVDQRIDTIARLKRKYGAGLEDVFRALDKMTKELARTGEIEQQIVSHQKKIDELTKDIRKKSTELSDLRKKAAVRLSKMAQEELKALDMGKARFKIDFSGRTSHSSDSILTESNESIGPSGIDVVGFLLSPNPGEPVKPLSKIASGGELSRIVLALKAVLSKTQSLETLVFDEVDAGIGGATSQKVGEKLKQLSKSHQVICITHLAQIARYGRQQFKIEKQVIRGRTSTRILPLEDRSERVKEIARMIGGTEISETTLAHAQEMLEHPESCG